MSQWTIEKQEDTGKWLLKSNGGDKTPELKSWEDIDFFTIYMLSVMAIAYTTYGVVLRSIFKEQQTQVWLRKRNSEKWLTRFYVVVATLFNINLLMNLLVEGVIKYYQSGNTEFQCNFIEITSEMNNITQTMAQLCVASLGIAIYIVRKK